MPYQPRQSSPGQDAVLDKLERRARVEGSGAVALLDLDGCLFDTRHRQIHILRAWAEHTGDYALAAVTAEHFVDRDIARTLANAGLDPERAKSMAPELRRFWIRRFFDEEHAACDLPLPASTRLVKRFHQAGLHVVYLTGRLARMRPATERALLRFGFPWGGERTTLITKDDHKVPDRLYKAQALDQVARIGRVVIALDNEPENVNLFAARFPDADVVLVETDASSMDPAAHLPRIRGFLRTGDLVG